MTTKLLSERYQLIKCVGGGGMADVYQAEDKLLDRVVAIKILKKEFINDEQFVERFRREAQAAAKMSHPNIVTIYDVGKDDDLYYIVMEYVEGETLKEYATKEGPFSIEATIKMAIEIASALEVAHASNLIHCDIKPHNILISKTTGRLKVADFGIARAISSNTMVHTKTIVGSVHYISPEQARGTGIGPQSDIYSLGVVLYELLAGRTPFNGDNPVNVAIQHIQDQPPSLRGQNGSVTPLLESVVMKALAKDLSQRYATIGQFIVDLKDVLNNLQNFDTKRIVMDEYATQRINMPADVLEGTMELGASMQQFPSDGRMQASNNLQNVNANYMEKKKNNTWKVVVGFAVLLLLGFALGAFLAFGNFWSGKDVAVVDVVGKQVDIARNMLISQNLRVSITDGFSDTVPVGYIISQNPPAGTMVKEQRSITLVVSKGGETVVMPDLKGLKRKDAEDQLNKLGLSIGDEKEQVTTDVPPDTVISTNPRAGAKVSRGSKVDLSVNKASTQKVTLPDLRGLDKKTALGKLDSLKLKVGSISEIATNEYSAGTVAKQDPSPGAELVEGSSVELSIAKTSASSNKRQSSISFVVPDSPGKAMVAVNITVTDSDGRRTIYDGTNKAGDVINKTLDINGSARVQFYVNGTAVKEESL